MCHLNLIGWPLSEALATVQRDYPGLTIHVVGCNPLKPYTPPCAEKRIVRQRWDAELLELTVSVFRGMDDERHTNDQSI